MKMMMLDAKNQSKQSLAAGARVAPALFLVSLVVSSMRAVLPTV